MIASFDGFAGCDAVFCLGGDGTLLTAARMAAPLGLPIMGINLGRMGYLTETELSGAGGVIRALADGAYRLERRIMLEARGAVGPVLALNDICAVKTDGVSVVDLEVSVNGRPLDVYRADGVIVSTPTGSTAYNLSAGGPLLPPDARMICVTPAAAHSLVHRPIVVHAEDVVGIRAVGACRARIAADGREAGTLSAGGSVAVRRAEYDTTLIRIKEPGFYEILKKKMG
jgi:NAD+ kinase